MNTNITLKDRMRVYEKENTVMLPVDVPVVIRVDGHAFKTFTKGMDIPFDRIFRHVMQQTMMELCAFAEGCILGYSFSDEISLVLKVARPETESPWFKYNTQKLASLTAAQATMLFNKYFAQAVSVLEDSEYKQKMLAKSNTAIFDGRAFSLPENEIGNYLLFRQSDCIRNSIHAVGRANFSHNQLNGKNCDEMRSMLHAIGKDWDNYDTHNRFGVFCRKYNRVCSREVNGETILFERPKWELVSVTPDVRHCIQTNDWSVLKNEQSNVPSQNIRRLMKEKNIAPQTIADALKVEISDIVALCNGQLIADAAKLNALAAILGVELTALTRTLE